MRNTLLLTTIIFQFLSLQTKAQDTRGPIHLPDTVKAVQLYGEIAAKNRPPKESYIGIATDVVSLVLEADKNEEEIVFRFPKGSKIVAKGLNVEADKDELEWDYDWNTGEIYKLLISTTGDSVENFSLYSGYFWMPKESKWKFIGTCRIDGRWSTLKDPAVIYTSGKKNSVTIDHGKVWVQRNTGSWKNLTDGNPPTPVAIVSNHIDSTEQHSLEIQQLENDIKSGKTETKNSIEGVYYSIMYPGTGRQVSINDTVTVHYKGYLYSDGTVFDQTKEKPATFPLKRLIRGWQLAIPLLKVGGKVKIVIPSGMAYSVRTRAAKIPPNSILVFEVEVVDTKAPGQ